MSPSQSQDEHKGKLYIVGTGPGKLEYMTVRAMKAIAESDIVIGNAPVPGHASAPAGGKKSDQERDGKRSGAGPKVRRAVTVSRCFHRERRGCGHIRHGRDRPRSAEKFRHECPLRGRPGVTAATSAASCLGSPLSGDFVVVSLSDLLTPMEVIEKRLEHAFSMGVPVVLYNPRSHGRPHNLGSALRIARKHLGGSTPVGVVKNAYREGEETVVKTLDDMIESNEFVDMHSTVIVGGEESVTWRAGDVTGMVTPRGYGRKYVY